MNEERTERRLAAILAADVVGYSRLMRSDEEDTLSRLKAIRHDLWGPKLAHYRGRVVKLMGDGALVEFSSVVDAVHAAVETQQSLAAHNAELPQDRRIDFRVGINMGDVVIDGEDIHGDGVNIAARLEALAPPGGVCISGNVHEQVRDRTDLPFRDMGEQEVKNIDRPVAVWQWMPDGSPADAAAGGNEPARLALPDKPSIAVLPFDNMSGDAEQEYFSDGITEDIITALSKFRWFFVTARNSTFAYKGQSPNIPQVARELGVQYVLEGSVRKAGNRVRITGQLIDALTGNHIWAERYDRELVDIFDLQDEITSAITGAVAPELAETQRTLSTKKAPESLDAWDLHNRAMWHLYRFNKADAAAAEALFERAIAADPGFATAHASLSYQHYLNVVLGYSESPAEELDAGFKAAKRAVELDEKDSLGHCMMGRILVMSGQHDASIAALDRAMDLNPNSAIVRLSMGLALAWAGRNAEAIPHLDEALRLSPNDPSGWSSENMKASCLAGLERYDEALVAVQRAIQYPNSDFWPRLGKMFALFRMGKMAEAEAALAEARVMRPDLSVALVGRMLAGFYEEGKAEYLDDLRKVGLPET